MKIAATLIILLSSIVAQGQRPFYEWAKQVDAYGVCRSKDVVADDYGNSYACGHFFGTVDFGSTQLTNSGDFSGYVAKFDPNGNPIWALKFKGYDRADVYELHLNSQGHIIVFGSFEGSISLGSDTYSSSNTHTPFIAEIDTSGNILQSQTISGSGFWGGIEITVGNDDNVYLAGISQGAIVADLLYMQ